MRKKILILIIFVLMLFASVNSVLAETYDNIDINGITSCGNGMIDNIPTVIPKVVSIAYTLIHVAVPVVLVIMGSLDLFKGITAQKDDDIKKGQQMFIKRLIAAALIFFVFAIVKLVISVATDKNVDKTDKIMECANCFINNVCDKKK